MHLLTLKSFLLLCIILTVVMIHWAAAGIGIYPPGFDEAQYWVWSHTFDFGYYSKPPMIAWLIAAGTTLFGDTIFGIRFFAILCHAGAAFGIYHTALLLFNDKRIGWLAALQYILLPAVTYSSAFFSADAPLLCFWSLALYAFVRILQLPSRTYHWLALGICTGLGLLSKYTMLLFGASAVLYLLCTAEHRHLLYNPRAWLALAVALITVAPNIYWNMQHQFVTLSHTSDNVFSKSIQLYPDELLAFLAGQAAIIGPILAILLIYSYWQRRHIHSHHLRLLSYFFWPTMLAGMLVSLLSSAQIHWTGPAYIAATLWLSYTLLQLHKTLWLYAALIFHGTCLLIFYSIPSLWPATFPHPMQRMVIWNEGATTIKPWLEKHPDGVVMADERKFMGPLAYQLRHENGTPYPVVKWNPTDRITDYFDMVWRPHNQAFHTALLISRNPELTKHISTKNAYYELQRIQKIAIIKEQGYVFYLYQLNGFKGFTS